MSRPRLMSEHLSTVQMRHFGARTLPAPEMTALAEHIASCGTCQQQFQQTRRERGADARLSFTLTPESFLRHEHLKYEQLAHYLDGGLDAEEREILDLHVQGCEGCREDIRSLREFRRQIAPEMGVSYAPASQASESKAVRHVASWFWWKPAYAAAAVAVLVIALVTALSLRDRSADERQAQVSQQASEGRASGSEEKPAGTPMAAANDAVSPVVTIAKANSNTGNMTPSVKSSMTAPAQARAQSATREARRNPLTSTSNVAELNEGDQKITIDSAGNVTGLDHLSQADVQLVKETLIAQNVSRSEELAGLVGEQGALRGSSTAGQSFRLLSPSRTVIANDRPTFKWEGVPGATGYRVYVGDTENREAANSGELPASSTEWTPRTPLPRGRIYSWVVIAKVNGSDVIAPAASQPEVKFKVLSSEALRELSKLQNGERSHLALGVYYARVGMVEEAEREFTVLARQNPKSLLAQKLLQSVRSWR